MPKFIFTIIALFGLTLTQPLPEEDSAATVPKVNLKNVDAKQLQCLATNIYYEAGHETIKGQAAVARVVMNRVQNGFAKNACAVVYQKTWSQDKMVCQFSWVCEGKQTPANNYRYAIAKQVAYDVMVNGMYHDIIPKTALFFHSIEIDPLWPYKQVARIGNHVFYSKAKKNYPV